MNNNRSALVKKIIFYHKKLANYDKKSGGFLSNHYKLLSLKKDLLENQLYNFKIPASLRSEILKKISKLKKNSSRH